MKVAMKKTALILALLFVFSILALSACGAPPTHTVRVLLEEGAHFVVTDGNVRDVERGGDVSFAVSVEEGYYYVSDNVGATYENGILTLCGVTAPKTIVLDVAATEHTVYLAPVDGMTVTTASGDSSESTLSVPYGNSAVFDVTIDDDHIFAGAVAIMEDGTRREVSYENGKLTLNDVRMGAELYVSLRNAPTGANEAVVRLLEGPGYTVVGESEKTVDIGDDVTFDISVSDGYYYVSDNCGAVYSEGKVTLENVSSDQDILLVFRAEDARYEYFENGRVEISDAEEGDLYVASASDGYVFTYWTVDDEIYSYANDLVVPYDVRPEPVFVPENSRLVTYHVNGGHLKGSTDETVTYAFDSEVYLYPASFGEWCFRTFEREGYVPVEYNTRADGSGNAYSLGSHVFENGSFDLYVMWRKETPEIYFETDYEMSGDERTGVILTRYVGSDTSVVLPTAIDGLPVVSVKDGCFAGGEITEVVITRNIDRVEAGAFRDCEALTTVYLCDTVEYIYDESFSGCDSLSELRMIAVRPPVYSDHLIGSTVRRFEQLYADDSRTNIVFYGGSSIFQGIDGQTLSRMFNSFIFRIMNGGQNAYVSGALMLDLYSSFMNRGDVMVFVPEYGGSVYTNEWDLPTWIALETFYDAFRYIDIRDYANVFGSYTSFQHGSSNYSFAGKLEMLADGNVRTYEDYNDTLDEWFTRADNFVIVKVDLITETQSVDFDKLKRLVTEVIDPLYKEKISSRGIKLYFAACGVWEDAYPNDIEEFVEYEEWLKAELPFPYISDCLEHFFPLEYMSDGISHLTREGAVRHSEILGQELMLQMREDGYSV